MKAKLSNAQAVNNKTKATFQNSQLNNNNFSAKETSYQTQMIDFSSAFPPIALSVLTL